MTTGDLEPSDADRTVDAAHHAQPAGSSVPRSADVSRSESDGDGVDFAVPLDDGSGGAGAPALDREQGWLVGTAKGRIVASAMFALIAYMLVIWNLPSSEIRNELRPGIRPIVNAMAIDQGWAVFAPNPTTVSLAVEAEVTFESGETVTYRFPDGDPFIGAYREYRWRKIERRVRLDSYRRLWRPTAEWIARQYDEHVTHVTLVRIFSDTPEPGSGDEREWQRVEFFDLDIAPDGESVEAALGDEEAS